MFGGGPSLVLLVSLLMAYLDSSPWEQGLECDAVMVLDINPGRWKECCALVGRLCSSPTGDRGVWVSAIVPPVCAQETRYCNSRQNISDRLLLLGRNRWALTEQVNIWALRRQTDSEGPPPPLTPRAPGKPKGEP
ncbi:hypothetical protein J6590_032661 [Homalodisca vitripennis]|nr:hypothetical protein J6590_032661 [Homalodisca vitripennis]